MFYQAKEPKFVADKLDECRFFLNEMVDTEDEKEFGFFLSAFLSAFRAAANRSFGVTKHHFGEGVKRALITQAENHDVVDFLIGQTNNEVHGDGPVICRQFTVRAVHAARLRHDRPENPWHPPADDPHYGPAVAIRRAVGWRFADDPRDVIELCREGIQALRGLIMPILALTPTAEPLAAYLTLGDFRKR